MTFRSAAGAYRERVVGVLLSGMLDDGASGMWEIARHGGVTVVQNPAEAQFPSMPLSALHDVPVDYEARAEEMGPLLSGLVSGTNSSEIRPRVNGPETPELFSGLTCPECRGPLWNRKGGPDEFHCRVGHIFSLKALIDEHTSTQERKLYEALVSLEEGATLTEYATHHVEEPHREALQKEAGQLRQQASAIRRLLDDRVIAPLS